MANTASSKAAGSGATPLNYRPPTNPPPSYAPGGTQTMSTYTAQLHDRNKKTEAEAEAAAQHKKASSSRIQQSLAHSLLPDLPLLMHGSGDVLPEHVNPKSVAILAQLTENYVEKLVRAAVDAHDIFTDGEVVGGGACLGIPPFPSSTAAAMHDSDNDEDDNNEKADEMSEEAIIRKRKRAEKEKISKKFKKIDYWDQPLPTSATATAGGAPGSGGGIGGEEDSSNGGVGSSVNDSDSSDDDSDNDSSSSQKIISSSMRGSGRKQSGFVGALPIDLHANQRTRDYYVSAPTAMDVRSFIFPICHDAVLYQRVKEMQANRRSIGRDMMDHVLLQAVQEEGVNLGRVDVSDMWSSVLNAAAVAAAEAEEAKVGVNNTLSSDVAGNNKAKDGEEKKSIEAGLVDTNVDASWPGMNPLSRGTLW